MKGDMFFSSIRKLSNKQKINELLAGITSAMTMMPESLSFAIIAGLAPVMGLYAALIMGLVTAVLGGRPGMISGGAGATIIVMIALIQDHGVEYLLGAVVLAGILQIITGVMGFGKFIRLIPQPVMYGFLNGLAVVIFLAQLQQLGFNSLNSDAFFQVPDSTWIMLGLSCLTILIILLWPLVNKAIPASLVGIFMVTVLVLLLSIDTKKVVDIAPINAGLPGFHIPKLPLSWQTIYIILPYSVVMACVGLLESLLTLQMVDEITYSKGNANKEAKAQGYGNVLCGFFGAMGGCAMVAQTMVNLNSNGRTRLSAIVSGLVILLVLVLAGPVIGQIPVAALIGVMVVVAITTFKWASFKLIFTMPKADVITGILVALITIFLHNLALAVFTGVIISALVFAWQNAQNIKVLKKIENNQVVYYCQGPLFFGSVTSFLENFNPKEDSQQVIIDFRNSKVCDMSAIEALNKVTKLYKDSNKNIVLRSLSADCCLLLDNAKDVVQINLQTDPTYKVMP
ncbi:SulP family inorganic anion transporter [Myroides sp. LJL119]